MEYKPTIGLEIHAELKTRTKMFCDSLNDPDEIGNFRMQQRLGPVEETDTGDDALGNSLRHNFLEQLRLHGARRIIYIAKIARGAGWAAQVALPHAEHLDVEKEIPCHPRRPITGVATGR